MLEATEAGQIVSDETGVFGEPPPSRVESVKAFRPQTQAERIGPLAGIPLAARVTNRDPIHRADLRANKNGGVHGHDSFSTDQLD
ncbi:MAG TPA: hypothetical protein VII20_11575 [Roseiarcus sp.]|jgi:hypothetical protein